VHTADSLILEPISLEVEIATEKLKKYKSPGINHLRQNWSKQEVTHYILRSTKSLILFGIRKNCH